MTDRQHHHGMSGGEMHKWVVFSSSYLVMLVNIGFIYSVGALYVDVMNTFDTSRAETAVIQSTLMGVTFGSGLINGALINRFGTLTMGLIGSTIASIGLILNFFATSVIHFVIFIGVISGIGMCSVYICSAAAIGQQFTGKKRLLLMGVHGTGAAVGGMVYPYLIRYLSVTYGVRGALLILGGISMNTIPGCFLWKPRKVQHTNSIEANNITQIETIANVPVEDSEHNITLEVHTKNSGEETSGIQYLNEFPVLQHSDRTETVRVQKSSKTGAGKTEQKGRLFFQNLRQIATDRVFMLFVGGFIVTNPSLLLIVMFLVDIYLDSGLTSDDASLGLLLLNLMSMCGRMIPGILMKSKLFPSTLFIPILSALLAALVIFILTLVRTKWLLILCSSIVGIPLAMTVTLMTVMPLHLLGEHNMPTGTGLLFTANAVGTVIVGPVSGYMRDTTGSYNIIFYIASVGNLLAAMLFILAHITRRNKKKLEIKRRSAVYYIPGE